MQFVDEFRDGLLIKNLSKEILHYADPQRCYRIMEVCGGHTYSIYRFGLHDLLPPNVELIHGPGCPVCVLPMGRVDECLDVAREKNLLFSCFGDMMRVPGQNGSPLEAKAKGVEVRMVYSPLDSLKIAMDNPQREVLFFAIGFETTAPATALTILKAKQHRVQNFSVFCNHVLIIPAIRAILESPDMRLDGFIGPGHVSTIIGCRPYEFVSKEYGKPIVISGFEPLDILESILRILRQLNRGKAQVENQYNRVVPWNGNTAALRLMAEVFELRPYFEWRGLGFIARSALRIKQEFQDWDAEKRYAFRGISVSDPKASQCGEVLKGVLKPFQCKLFGTYCTPEHPVGALMVSSEGACAAYYHHAFHGLSG
ncbi:hydrogenase formation protein HypD [Candidatus Methylacidiphilum infernorum]|uniref:[NiFe] hydrogenase metallocenter assembly protein HypD n=1 Tax=Methylacidiphilum infernorum (isolate V4) TaxID=481448 RepID=B3DXE0_METI4|nr:hydrogenase formation protein HypD [Candidatus Methylacidiphilum infernorum]ACD83849.1 [NiFe] hydrogenase metallocenter assembly protein HypD [Methylacidiphilum infernorum V4]